MSANAKNILYQTAEKAGGLLTAITFHDYYFRGDIAHVNQYLDPKYYTELENKINFVRNAISTSSHPNMALWNGETADAWHSGTPNVTDRYVSGFLWLEKLGLSAKMGVSVVMRQTFYGHNYGLLDIDMNPNPDYWLSWVHKTLVGTTVLKAVYWSDSATTRVYAHCTNTHRTKYPAGSVTVFALNVNTTHADTLQMYAPLNNQNADAYIFSPPAGDKDGILSKFTAVNGQVLHLTNNDTQLPKLIPVTVNSTPGLKLPALSMAFYVFPQAKASVCF